MLKRAHLSIRVDRSSSFISFGGEHVLSLKSEPIFFSFGGEQHVSALLTSERIVLSSSAPAKEEFADTDDDKKDDAGVKGGTGSSLL
jgi:hypothetical protein